LNKANLRNNKVQISVLGDVLLLWKPKALCNSLGVPVTKNDKCLNVTNMMTIATAYPKSGENKHDHYFST